MCSQLHQMRTRLQTFCCASNVWKTLCEGRRHFWSVVEAAEVLDPQKASGRQHMRTACAHSICAQQRASRHDNSGQPRACVYSIIYCSFLGLVVLYSITLKHCHVCDRLPRLCIISEMSFLIFSLRLAELQRDLHSLTNKWKPSASLPGNSAFHAFPANLGRILH